MGLYKKAKAVKTSEKEVLKACLEYLELRGYMAWRNNSGAYKTPEGRLVRFGKAGSPDIIGLTKEGRFIGIECKSDTGILSDWQKAHRDMVIKNKGLYVLARSIEDLQEAGL